VWNLSYYLRWLCAAAASRKTCYQTRQAIMSDDFDAPATYEAGANDFDRASATYRAFPGKHTVDRLDLQPGARMLAESRHADIIGPWERANDHGELRQIPHAAVSGMCSSRLTWTNCPCRAPRSGGISSWVRGCASGSRSWVSKRPDASAIRTSAGPPGKPWRRWQ
jgi:hypothetical protein